MKFSIKDFFSKCNQILNGKYFLCSDKGAEAYGVKNEILIIQVTDSSERRN